MLYYISDMNNENFGSGKPRTDAEKIIKELGYQPIKAKIFEDTNKIVRSIKRYIELKNKTENLKKGDVLFFQHPKRNETYFLKFLINKLNKRGVQTISLVHDLNIIRYEESSSLLKKLRMKWEDLDTLKAFNKVIVHNESMANKLKKWRFRENQLILLHLFDYLTDDDYSKIDINEMKVIIAGNLAIEKAKYSYNLPQHPNFNLYGINYDEKKANNHKNVKYCGVFSPEEVSKIEGSFGLVWDGESSDTCSGEFGNYLKYNNPYKLSMYLAAGIPVIVWKKSALAKFIEENNLGLTVNSLYEIDENIRLMKNEEFDEIKNNVKLISYKLRAGTFLEEALKRGVEK